jgi:hypothetical protein
VQSTIGDAGGGKQISHAVSHVSATTVFGKRRALGSKAFWGHSKADTTVNVYMQPIEAGVKATLDAIYLELTAREEVAGGS